MTTSKSRSVVVSVVAAVVSAVLLLVPAGPSSGVHRTSGAADTPEAASAVAAAARPNIFIYHLDDLRDALPGSGFDPLQFMPKARSWMSQGTRYTQSFVNDPSCCPSRASMMTGRYPHNDGVPSQQDGASFDGAHSMACYLQGAGYRTYEAGKFLTTWPKTKLPPCFTHSTVMWGGYNNSAIKVDGVSRRATGYTTTFLGTRGREYVNDALTTAAPFLLYETPQAPHWVNVTLADGTTTQRAVPSTKYASAPVGSCKAVAEPDRSDKPAYVVRQNYSIAQGQAMCESQMRAIMTADDEFAATMQLLSDKGVLANTLVILSSDNGYLWGEHGRWEKFTPYEPVIRTPLLVRWPGHITAGTNTTRLATLVDILPTLLQAAGVTIPANAPRLDGESLLGPSNRTTVYNEYYRDTVANPNIPAWKMVRTRTAKYVETYDDTGTIIAREYYNLTNDPNELTNLLGDSSTANDPPASTVSAMKSELNAYAGCSGAGCVR
jgi:N-acetylglucosamine-6-sulfatase